MGVVCLFAFFVCVFVWFFFLCFYGGGGTFHIPSDVYLKKIKIKSAFRVVGC